MQFIEGLRQLSAKELGLLGMNDVAYVKPIVEDGADGICGARRRRHKDGRHRQSRSRLCGGAAKRYGAGQRALTAMTE